MGFDYRISTGLGKTEPPVLAQSLLRAKTQGEGAVTSQKTEPDLPASAGGSPVEVRVGNGSRRGQGRTGPQPGKGLLGGDPLGGRHEPYHRACASGQPPGRESNPSHQQVTELKFYWAGRPCKT